MPTSDSIQVLSGVPQGTVLEPLLFLVDDCILYRCIKKPEKFCDTLQQDLNSPTAWEKKWGMAFHTEKCSAIRVTRAWKPISSSYTLKGHTLNTGDSTRYLGVELQSSMSWNRQMEQAVKKANISLGFLRRNLGSQTNRPDQLPIFLW